MKSIFLSTLIVAMIILSQNCEIITDPDLVNPYDTTSTDFIQPQTIITSGPEEGQIINNHTVIFTWTGNETVSEYSFTFDNSEWSNWSTDTIATFTYLDEGEHLFQVKGRSPAKVEEDTASVRNFTIDAVQGSALMFHPRKVKVQTNDSFTVEVLVEEVTNLIGLSFQIPYDDPAVDLVTYEIYESETSFLAKQNATVLSIEENDEVNQVLKITLGRAAGDPVGVDGTGAIMNITFQFTGSSGTQINFQNCQMQGPEMQEITINEIVECIVELEQY